MQKKIYLPIGIFVGICILLIIGSILGVFAPFSGIFKVATAPFLTNTFHVGQSLFSGSSSTEITKLKSENQELTNQLVAMQEIKKDNQALRDQFNATAIKTQTLLPASVIGAPSFIPGVTTIEKFVIDKGQVDGVKIGQAVVYKNNLVGKVDSVSPTISQVQVVSATGSSFTGKTSNNNSLGVIKGQGLGHMLLDNVSLPSKLGKGDIVVTKGDVNAKGQGYPPNLVVGKVINVNKSPSALFQTADVVSLVDLPSLTMVFVMTQ